MEKLSYNMQSPSFGWRYPMHKTIVLAAARDTKLSKEVIEMLSESVQKPDFDEFFLLGQKHFYYPNGFLKSFLDFTGKYNARSVYQKHVDNMLSGESSIDEAGRAMHFLQEMTQPNHIEQCTVFKKVKDIKMHHNFEAMAHKQENDLIDNAVPVLFDTQSFEELFDDTVLISSLNEIPNSSNTEMWGNIAQRGVDIALGATRKFIELIDRNGFKLN